MGQQLAFGLEQPTAGPDLPERQVRRGGPGGLFGCGQVMLRGGEGLAGGRVDGCLTAVASGLGGRGVQGVGEVGVRADHVGSGRRHVVFGAGLRRVRDQPVEVISVVGVAVQCVEGEVLP